MTGLADYWRMYKARGIKRVFHEIYENALYDLIHGVDTQHYKPLNQYQSLPPEVLKHSVQYQPAYTSVIREAIIRAMHLLPASGSFVDLGCGKGKVMLEAHRFPFTKVHGVEIESNLASIAAQNLQRLYPTSTKYKIHCMNALDFIFPIDMAVLFLFNPFDEIILQQLLQKLETLCQQTQRNIVVIYVNPVFLNLFNQFKVCYTAHKYMQDLAVLQWKA